MLKLSGRIAPKTDLIGMKVGRLTIVKKAQQDKHYRTYYVCMCECGKEKKIAEINLRHYKTMSCGCLISENAKKKFTKHGDCNVGKMSAEYQAYNNMKARCYNPSYRNYKNWGGRGIKVCERWINSYEAFLEDMGRRPSSRHSLDRYPDNDGHYEPGNCRWATLEQQKRNIRTNRWFEYNGEKMIIKDWANKLGIDDRRIHSRLKKQSFDQIIEHFESRNK
jgi:hypothetical protein